MDELNAVMGVLVTVLPSERTDLREDIQRIQRNLFHVGAWLATTPESAALSHLKDITEETICSLEKAMDRMEENLPELTGFILPGGHPSAAWAHIARTVCRRAERRVVGIPEAKNMNGESRKLSGVLIYLNRLSDYLFVLARYFNHIAGINDILWEK